MTGKTSKDKNTPPDAGQSFDRACTGSRQPQQQQMPCFIGQGTCRFAKTGQEQQMLQVPSGL